MKKPIIIGNWKMNLTLQDARNLIINIRQGLSNISRDKIDLVICPSFIHIPTLKYLLPTTIDLGAQNAYWEDWGPYTGEISPPMLHDAGCKYVIIGHSERRNNLLETNEMIKKKTSAALKNNIIPIICVGENKEEREKNMTDEIIRKQVSVSMEKLNKDEVSKTIIAYEPIWAIGSGNPAHPEDAKMIARMIKNLVAEKFDKKTSEKFKVIYGGSVNTENIENFVKEENISGALVGGESVKSDSFINIVKNVIK